MKINTQILLSNLFITAVIVVICVFAIRVSAATPSGSDWFQLLVSPQTGNDNTGDGGTGSSADLNYFYVGQMASQTIQINSGGTEAANIWVDYDPLLSTISNLQIGSYFSSWAGQTISGGRVKSTGYRTSGTSSGTGNFGSFDLNFLKPSEAAYGTSSPALLDINTGVIGATTESNISLSGNDILDSAEDFQLHIWADTIKPYAENPSPSNAATAVAVTDPFSFDLRDSKNGEGDNSGVGTGVNTSTPPGAITFDDGGGPVSMTSFDSYSCSGIWGTNYCAVTVNPTSPLAISGDSRNFKYNTTYTATVSGFKDQASSAQDQLGDANGPNTMNSKVWTFTTEPDSVAPQVSNQAPAPAATSVSTSTNISFDITDRKSYPSGPSGTGIDLSTCKVNISSASFALTTYTDSSSGVTASPIDYGYNFDINPSTNFAQNESATVSVFDCQDLAGNIMSTTTWNFVTSDTDAPYVDGLSPLTDTVLNPNGTVSFHIKDDAGGVDLNNLVLYLNGIYYSNGGGAVTVTTTGTIISTGSSLDFNGGNYLGDTTGITGIANDYIVTLDPQSDFIAGEAVTLLIYAKDLAGNIMPRQVFEFNVPSNASCASGSTYCGSNTSWNGAQCIGVGGGGGSGGGGAGSYQLTITSSSATQIDSDSILVAFYTSQPAIGWVSYGNNQPASVGSAPTFGYDNITKQDSTPVMYHVFQINNLLAGQLYYFLPVIQSGEGFARGSVLPMTPAFSTQYIEKETIIRETKVVEITGPEKIIIRSINGQGTEVNVKNEKFLLEFIGKEAVNVDGFDVIQVSPDEKTVNLSGIGIPGESLRLIIY